MCIRDSLYIGQPGGREVYKNGVGIPLLAIALGKADVFHVGHQAGKLLTLDAQELGEHMLSLIHILRSQPSKAARSIFT